MLSKLLSFVIDFLLVTVIIEIAMAFLILNYIYVVCVK